MRFITAGATSQSVYFDILDSTSTTGGRKTGLAFNTASLQAWYTRNGAAAVQIGSTGALITQTAAGAWTSAGFAEVSAANAPGQYRLDVPNAAFAAGVSSVVITIFGATGMAQVSYDVQLTVPDLQAVLATPTNITGGTITTVTTVTNQLTVAAIATGVWTDTTAADFTTALSVGKSVMNGVTLGTGLTINDLTTKTGFSLSVAPPTSAAIATAVWQDTTAGDFTTALSVGKSLMNGVSLGTGLTVNALTGGVTVTTNNDKTGYALTQTFPTNFSSLAITVGGAVTAGTVSDKTGYSLSQAFPSNFSALGISIGGHISTVDTLTTYTGNTPQTGDSFARLGVPAGVSVSADIAAIKSDTGTILTDVNTGAGAIYTRIGAPAGASIAADIAAVETNAVGIKVKTDALSIDASGNVSITSNIKKNSAKIGFMLVMTDSTTHAPTSGLIVTPTRSIDGAAFGACTNAVSGVTNGTYKIDLSAADVNGDHIMLRFTAPGADDLNIEIVTQP